MCRVRLVHFTQHDVRVPMATQLFSDGPDAGDFVSSGLVSRCNCGQSVQGLLDANEGGSGGSGKKFETCPWHACCVMWYQAARCKWYWENREQLLDEEEPEFQCQNCYLLSEYHPLSLLVEDDGEEGLSSLSSSSEEEDEQEGEGWWRSEPQRNEVPYSMPAFPAEILYSHDIVGGEPVGEGSHGVYNDRVLVQDAGERLWQAKRQLRDAIEEATSRLDDVVLDLAGHAGLLYLAEDPTDVVSRIFVAHMHVTAVRYCEKWAALMYRKMMRNARYVFVALGRMPETGGNVTAPDGSYSISREELDLADLSLEAIIKTCDGPLRQYGLLRQRLKLIKGVLYIPRALRSGCSKQPRRTSNTICRRKTLIRKDRAARPGKLEAVRDNFV